MQSNTDSLVEKVGTGGGISTKVKDRGRIICIPHNCTLSRINMFLALHQIGPDRVSDITLVSAFFTSFVSHAKMALRRSRIGRDDETHIVRRTGFRGNHQMALGMCAKPSVCSCSSRQFQSSFGSLCQFQNFPIFMRITTPRSVVYMVFRQASR